MDQAALDNVVARSLRLEAPTREELIGVLTWPEEDVLDLVAGVAAVRHRYFGRSVRMNFLLNIKSGLCPEDCHYCSQRRDSTAEIEKYPMLPTTDVVRAARMAVGTGARRFCIVASGRGPSESELDHVVRSVEAVRDEIPELEICACLGLLGDGQAERLRRAGVDAYNHNLNTTEGHYAEICSTHTHADRVRTVERATAAGLSPCSGVLVGMGESLEDIADMALDLRALRPHSVPVNFLIPIEGTPLAGINQLTPRLCLKVLAAFRLTFPDAELRIAGGREVHLRSLQPFALSLANSLFVGDYLTTRGQPGAADLAMIADAGYEPVGLDTPTGEQLVGEIRSEWPAFPRAAGADREAWAAATLAELEASGLRRRLSPPPSASAPPFNTNDYLGLAGHPLLAAAAAEAAAAHGTGATGSRLLSGDHALLARLEAELQDLKGTSTALVLGSAYLANVAVLQALGGPEVGIFSDRLNHASIIDAARLSRGRVSVHPHGDLETLRRQLRSTRVERRIIVSDGVFGMDGTLADVAGLDSLAREFDAWLVIDDSHGHGVVGPDGAGTWAAAGLASGDHVVHTGSLAKSYGSYGGFVAASAAVRDLLLNRGRALIFSAAPPPPAVAAAIAALEISRREPERAAQALAGAARLRERLGLDPKAAHPVVPVVVGSAEAAMRVAGQLQAEGLAVSAVRPPSVPEGTARLRLSVTAHHRPADIDRLADGLERALATDARLAGALPGA